MYSKMEMKTIKQIEKTRAYDNWPILNRVSLIPTVFARALRTSVSVGRYFGAPIRSTSLKKLRLHVRRCYGTANSTY